MTRAEYEKKYGQPPIVSATPIKMTRSEYNQKYGVKQEPKVGGAESFLSGVANITGGGKLTKAAAELFGGDTTESTISSALSSGSLVDQAKKLPQGDPRRRQLLEQANKQAGQALAQGQQRLTDLPTEKEVIGDSVQLATTLASLGVGSSVAKTVAGRLIGTGGKFGGLAAISGGAEAFGQDKNPLEILKSSLTSGAIGFGFGTAGQAASELIGLLSSPRVTETLYNKALGISKKTIEKGKSPAKMFLEEGISGTKQGILKKSNTIADESKKVVESILETSKRTHSSKQIIKQIEAELQAKFQNSLSADEIKAIVDNLPLNKLRTSPKITDKILNALRSELDNNFLGDAKWLNSSTAERTLALKTATNVMRGIVQTADDRLPGVFERWAKAITASRALRSELAKPHVLSNMLELMISAGFGGITGGLSVEGIKNAIATYALINAGQSAPVKTNLAKGFLGLGKANQGVAGQTLKTLFKTAIPGVSEELTP